MCDEIPGQMEETWLEKISESTSACERASKIQECGFCPAVLRQILHFDVTGIIDSLVLKRYIHSWLLNRSTSSRPSARLSTRPAHW